MTVRGYLVSDDFEGDDYPDAAMEALQAGFLRVARHTDCAVCHGGAFAQLAFVWPRNGFREFPRDFVPGVVQTVQGV